MPPLTSASRFERGARGCSCSVIVESSSAVLSRQGSHNPSGSVARVLLCVLAQFCDLIPVEVRMLVDDDLICEDIDLADCDDSFAYVKRIAFPAFYARQNKLIQELARVEQRKIGRAHV